MSSISSPTTTLQIENNTFTIESDANSILVVNSATDTNSVLRSATPPTSPMTTSTMTESGGYLKQLETELNKTKQKMEEIIQENVLIKEYNTHLARKLEKRQKSETVDDEDDDDSIVAYIDVQNIANKVEYYLNETNKLFKSDKDYTDSIKYFIKNIWSLIAHEYTDKNLDEFKIVRDELIAKLDRVDLNHKEALSASQVTTTDSSVNVDLITNSELESLKSDTNNLKEKLIKQNEMIKKFKDQIEAHQKQPVVLEEQANEETNDDEYISPGTSPSHFLINSYNKYMNKKENKPEHDPTTSRDGQEVREPIERTNNQGNVYYLHNLNDFVAIQTGSMDATLLTDENVANPTLISSAETNPLEQQIRNPEIATVFTCDDCKTSFDATAFENTDDFIQKFEAHIRNCKSETKLTCMFCLELFDKNEQFEYEEHVAIHLMEN